MNTDKYTFERFISRVQHLDYLPMLQATEAAIAEMEIAVATPSGFRPVQILFADRLHSFQSFLKYGTLRPETLKGDLVLFKQTGDLLVKKRQMGEDVLRIFEGVL